MIAAFLWGTTFVAQSVGAGHVGAFVFNAARSVVAAIFLLGVCAVRRWMGRAVRSPRRTLLIAGACCGAALTVASWLQQKGMETTSPGKAGFITALYIVLVPILSVFVKRRRPPVTIWICVALAAAGLWRLCVTESWTVQPGDALVLLCALCFAVHILTIDHFTVQVDGPEMSLIQFVTAAVLSALGAAVTGEASTIPGLRDCVGAVLYAGVFSSGVAYTLQIVAQKGSDPTVVSLLLSLESVFATVSGALVLHERLTGRELLGCALMLAAVVLAQIPEERIFSRSLHLPGRSRQKDAGTGGSGLE